MFLLPACAALFARGSRKIAAASLRPGREGITAWVCVWLSISVLVGYRFDVGGDWGNYFQFLDDVAGLKFVEVLGMSDPAYQLLNWLSVEMDWGIFGVNLIVGAIFAFGLIVFCRAQPGPWLALAISIPYLVIVVGMGYTRQSAALALEMLGLVALSKRSTFKFVIWIALAATFHKSAVLLLPVAALASSTNRYWTAAWVALTAVVLYYLLLASEVEKLYQNYVVAEYQSEGAAVRLLMNAVPAAILLIWRSRFQFTKSEASLWSWFAIISLALQGLFVISPSSTAIDRVALYMLPLQIVVFAHLPNVFGTQGMRYQGPRAVANSLNFSAMSSITAKNVTSLTAGVLLYYGVVQFVWLNYATNARLWLPYGFYPLESLR